MKTENQDSFCYFILPFFLDNALNDLNVWNYLNE